MQEIEGFVAMGVFKYHARANKKVCGTECLSKAIVCIVKISVQRNHRPFRVVVPNFKPSDPLAQPRVIRGPHPDFVGIVRVQDAPVPSP